MKQPILSEDQSIDLISHNFISAFFASSALSENFRLRRDKPAGGRMRLHTCYHTAAGPAAPPYLSFPNKIPIRAIRSSPPSA
jgi:hypothetical protein